MDRPQLFEYVRQIYGVEPDYPWNDWNAVLRHKDNNKWFGVVMQVVKDKLGLDGNAIIDIVNVKAEPMLIASLLGKEGFYPAFHMNKENWISICLDGSAPDNEIMSLVDMSYGMTETKKKTKVDDKVKMDMNELRVDLRTLDKESVENNKRVT